MFECQEKSRLENLQKKLCLEANPEARSHILRQIALLEAGIRFEARLRARPE